ncbi:hypothetical protein [Haloarcula halophila]|uniref:hypothetical protein n=1 Tax=Haloarcula TaxID=2237 RepID=UPI0023E40E36|nr:hypothetical protein [Halomicroarcula sp. DFY41]
MVRLPWRDDPDEPTESGGPGGSVGSHDAHPDAVVVCSFQDGTLAVYEDDVVIERVERSRFDDTTVPLADIRGVDHERGITIGYVQLEVVGVEPDAGGLFSDPVNAYTVHFGRDGRDCAQQARDAILERMSG